MRALLHMTMFSTLIVLTATGANPRTVG